MHIVIVLIIVLIIVVFQIKFFSQARKDIAAYRRIFPTNTWSAYSIKNIDSNENVVNYNQIRVSHQNPILKKIIGALNKYLEKNQGAASDFHLMKDVVERYCDAQEEKVQAQQPLPLYLGLMATMMGIIAGVAIMAWSGALANGTAMSAQLKPLFESVAVAMGASLLGIGLTTYLTHASKDAKDVVEADKNDFYTWLQTELLPVLSTNAQSELRLLSDNLRQFNATFSSNIVQLNQALSSVSNVSQQQTELIQIIKDIDIKKVARANIDVLTKLESCTKKLEPFNQYMTSVTTYLQAVQELNSRLGDCYERTQLIEEMAAYFQEENEQIEQRKKAIVDSVQKFDDAIVRVALPTMQQGLNDAMEEIERSAQESLDGLKTATIKSNQELLELFVTQREAIQQHLEELHEVAEGHKKMQELPGVVTEVSSVVSAVSETMKGVATAVPEEMKQIATSINGLSKQLQQVQQKISDIEGQLSKRKTGLIRVSSKPSVDGNGVKHPEPQTRLGKFWNSVKSITQRNKRK